MRRLISHVHDYPYPILDRDRVYGDLSLVLRLLQSHDAPRAVEELDEVRWYLLTHLIIAEGALVD